MKKVAITLLIAFLFCIGCSSDKRDITINSSPQPVPAVSSNQNSSVPLSKSDSLYSEIDNQMTVKELRQKLDEVKALERNAHQLVNMRRSERWMAQVADCMKIMQELKPKASAIRDEYKRMLSPAGINISGAAMNLVGCINCVEDDDDDCSYARDFINKAETELKKEMREARQK